MCGKDGRRHRTAWQVMGSSDAVSPPDAVYIRQRWINQHKREYAAECNKILVQHGAVRGDELFPQRHHARWRAQYLIRLLVALRLRERWELAEHVEKRPGGWQWSVEYRGRHGDG